MRLCLCIEVNHFSHEVRLNYISKFSLHLAEDIICNVAAYYASRPAATTCTQYPLDVFIIKLNRARAHTHTHTHILKRFHKHFCTMDLFERLVKPTHPLENCI